MLPSSSKRPRGRLPNASYGFYTIFILLKFNAWLQNGFPTVCIMHCEGALNLFNLNDLFSSLRDTECLEMGPFYYDHKQRYSYQPASSQFIESLINGRSNQQNSEEVQDHAEILCECLGQTFQNEPLTVPRWDKFLSYQLQRPKVNWVLHSFIAKTKGLLVVRIFFES